jgi:NAD(P)-dependent dehydrogenase (short-subunit alcohol dehydrogenase family)
MLIDAAIPRTALVTGGTRRLGLAMARALALAGYRLLLHCREADPSAEAARDELAALGPGCILLTADLRDESRLAGLLDGNGPVGVLVNNASTFEQGDWHDTDRANWDLHLEPNLRAPFVLTQHFARLLPGTAQGVVVNMLDQRVWSPTPHFVAYTVSKLGLWGLTQTMALALAPRIRVNAIGPGPALPSPRQTQSQFDRQCERLPLKRGTSPEEVGRALMAILSLTSMTGQMIALDGGQHLQWGPASASENE